MHLDCCGAVAASGKARTDSREIPMPEHIVTFQYAFPARM